MNNTWVFKKKAKDKAKAGFIHVFLIVNNSHEKNNYVLLPDFTGSTPNPLVPTEAVSETKHVMTQLYISFFP